MTSARPAARRGTCGYGDGPMTVRLKILIAKTPAKLAAKIAWHHSRGWKQHGPVNIELVRRECKKSGRRWKPNCRVAVIRHRAL